MIQTSRRAFLSGLIAAPAVIRVAPLMRIVPVRPHLVYHGAVTGRWSSGSSDLLKEIVALFKNTNEFLDRVELINETNLTSISYKDWRELNS